MAQSFSQIYLHIVFHTKARCVIKEKDLSVLHAYIHQRLIYAGSNCIKVGGIWNHVHILTTLPRTLTVSELVKQVKGRSSYWLSTKREGYEHFAWQGGYAAFSVSQSRVGSIIKYIEHQVEHHEQQTPQNEYLSFLKLHHIDYDDKYVFDDD